MNPEICEWMCVNCVFEYVEITIVKQNIQKNTDRLYFITTTKQAWWIIEEENIPLTIIIIIRMIIITLFSIDFHITITI